MRMRALAAAIALPLMLGCPAQAAVFYTAEQLNTECQDGGNLVFCLGFLAGVNDKVVIADEGAVCEPTEATLGNVLDAVTAFVKAHPEQANEMAATVVEAALADTWPC